MWVHEKSHEIQILKSIIFEKSFLADLNHISEYCHTGALESYHNERLKYTPKRVHFSFKGMMIRSMLAILDHNNNIGRKKVRESVRYSKSQKKWVYVPVYQAKNNNWRKELVDNICTVVRGQVKLDEMLYIDNIELPQNIAPISKPTMEEAKSLYFSRFNATHAL